MTEKEARVLAARCGQTVPLPVKPAYITNEEGVSDGEWTLAYHLRTSGADLPPHETEYPIPEDDRKNPKMRYRADFCWPAYKLVVEVMGRGHERWVKYNNDIIRTNRLVCWGYKVLWVTSEQLMTDPTRILGFIRQIIEKGDTDG